MEVTWNESTGEAFSLTAQTPHCCRLPRNIAPAHAERSLDSEQLTPGVSKKPRGERKKIKLLWWHLHQESYSYKRIVLFISITQVNSVVTFRKKRCETTSLPFSPPQFSSHSRLVWKVLPRTREAAQLPSSRRVSKGKPSSGTVCCGVRAKGGQPLPVPRPPWLAGHCTLALPHLFQTAAESPSLAF